MKKNLFLFLVAGLTFSTIHSQEIKDAMRYTQNDLHGTARFTAMSGAFGALGGDLSSVNVNSIIKTILYLIHEFDYSILNHETNNLLISR